MSVIGIRQVDVLFDLFDWGTLLLVQLSFVQERMQLRLRVVVVGARNKEDVRYGPFIERSFMSNPCHANHVSVRKRLGSG